MRIKDKVAIITGAGTGIGRATALLFAAEGAKVFAVGRRKGPIQQTAEEIRNKGGKALFYQADVSTAKGAEGMVHRCLEAYKRLDILFNNAGVIPSRTSITETSEEDWDQTIDVNLKGVYLCSKYAIPAIIKSGGGSIINTSSVAGLTGLRTRAAYGSSKGGVTIMTKGMALDYAPYNIRVNCICPGFVDTELTHEYLKELKKDEEAWNKIVNLHPLGRLGSPEDVANAALFLASDESSWITGIALPVDGGYMAQ